MYRYDADGRMTYKISAYNEKWMKIEHLTYNFAGDMVSAIENVYTRKSNEGIVVLAKRRTNNLGQSVL